MASPNGSSFHVYLLVNNEQLETAQKSELGIYLGLDVLANGDVQRQVLGGVGQADDVGLLAHSLASLKCPSTLTNCTACHDVQG